jgi:hypothetical protein
MVVRNSYLNAKAHGRRTPIKHCFVSLNKTIEALFQGVQAEMKEAPSMLKKIISGSPPSPIEDFYGRI